MVQYTHYTWVSTSRNASGGAEVERPGDVFVPCPERTSDKCLSAAKTSEPPNTRLSLLSKDSLKQV